MNELFNQKNKKWPNTLKSFFCPSVHQLKSTSIGFSRKSANVPWPRRVRTPAVDVQKITFSPSHPYYTSTKRIFFNLVKEKKDVLQGCLLWQKMTCEISSIAIFPVHITAILPVIICQGFVRVFCFIFLVVSVNSTNGSGPKSSENL